MSSPDQCAGEFDNLGDGTSVIPKKYAIHVKDSGQSFCFDIRTLWRWQESKNPNLEYELETTGQSLHGLKNPLTGELFSQANEDKIIQFSEILKNPSKPRSASKSPKSNPSRASHEGYFMLNSRLLSDKKFLEQFKDLSPKPEELPNYFAKPKEILQYLHTYMNEHSDRQLGWDQVSDVAYFAHHPFEVHYNNEYDLISVKIHGRYYFFQPVVNKKQIAKLKRKLFIGYDWLGEDVYVNLDKPINPKEDPE